MTARNAARLWVAQRLTAAFLAIAVVVHLATVIHAVQGGLSAGEILGRTQGNVAWLLFYAAFVVTVAVHAPIGLRNILAEHLRWRGPSLDAAMAGVAFALLVLGGRAVWAVYA